MEDITYPIDQELADKGYARLGWRNFWENDHNDTHYECYVKLGHKAKNQSHSNRGSDHTISCDICKYFYKLDTSD